MVDVVLADPLDSLIRLVEVEVQVPVLLPYIVDDG